MYQGCFRCVLWSVRVVYDKLRTDLRLVIVRKIFSSRKVGYFRIRIPPSLRPKPPDWSDTPWEAKITKKYRSLFTRERNVHNTRFSEKFTSKLLKNYVLKYLFKLKTLILEKKFFDLENSIDKICEEIQKFTLKKHKLNEQDLNW